jgi:hypothetical protein
MLRDVKIIDVESKGHVFRFTLGDDELSFWEGEGWDRLPYRDNAEPVDRQYVIGHHDIAFGFDERVIEPWHDPHHNVSKEQLRDRMLPAIIVVQPGLIVNAVSYAEIARIEHPGLRKLWLGDDETALASLSSGIRL